MKKIQVRGFSLIELMIAVAIVAILAAVAYPSYTDYVRQTHRQDAAGEILNLASGIERIKAQRFSYESANGNARALERYDIVVQANVDSYTISATPSDGQVDDLCGTLVYDEDGLWQFQDSGGGDLGLSEEFCLN